MALNSLVNRTIETLRGGVGQATRAGRGAANRGAALGKRFANSNPEPKSGMDDVTLARKVETEIFRPAGAPKGKIDVNAVDGVVWLRGEVKNQAASEAIEAKVRGIPEVMEVENLLHLPKAPAPSRTRAGVKKRTAAKKASPRRFAKTDSQAASTGTGRKPAPLGSQDTDAPAKTSASSVTGGITPTRAKDPGGSGSDSAS